MSTRRRVRCAAIAVALATTVVATAAGTAEGRPVLTPITGPVLHQAGGGQTPTGQPAHGSGPALPATAATAQRCPPSGTALGYSDALDKLVVGNARLGGLSGLARDPRTHSFAAVADRHGGDPSRVWFLRGLSSAPRPVGALVLRRPNGTPYTGRSADDEGLAVLSDGRFVVSSEVEPSVRIFSTRGVQQQSLRVPTRFRVAPAGQARTNASFEGLAIGPKGQRMFVAMEAPLSGDTGDGTFHRILDYARGRTGFGLLKQIGYRTDRGLRISEIAAYAPNRLLVMEIGHRADTGKIVRLYAVDVTGAADISRVPDLAHHPRQVVAKQLAVNVTACPDLGATSAQLQSNPLMDNYEAMATTPLGGHRYAVTLLSDDNFNPQQTTRLLRLAVRLP